jgi:hypothetical protein
VQPALYELTWNGHVDREQKELKVIQGWSEREGISISMIWKYLLFVARYVNEGGANKCDGVFGRVSVKNFYLLSIEPPLASVWEVAHIFVLSVWVDTENRSMMVVLESCKGLEGLNLWS